VRDDVKLPWYIDLLNINLDNHDLAEGRQRIRLLTEAFRRDGTRITENLDFTAGERKAALQGTEGLTAFAFIASRRP
jgi:hypothetical protein